MKVKNSKLRTLSHEASQDRRLSEPGAIQVALSTLLADTFAPYVKTKNFHWHMSGPHFRGYHLMIDEQAEQIFAMTDALAERTRKKGGTTIRSIGHIARLQRLTDNDAEFVASRDMLRELQGDNKKMTAFLRETHALCGEQADLATASLIEVWIDETERRTWFLVETTRESPKLKEASSITTSGDLGIPLYQ